MSIKKTAGSDDWSAPSSDRLVPVAPESSGGDVAKKRKRLAKAFARPLDKQLKEGGVARKKVGLAPGVYAQLVDLQQRLAGQGVGVKKSELLGAGLLLLAELDEHDVNRALERLPALA